MITEAPLSSPLPENKKEKTSTTSWSPLCTAVKQSCSWKEEDDSQSVVFMISKIGRYFYKNLKSATKPLKVLIAFTRPLITEFADNLNLKHPLLPTISPYPTMWLEAIENNPPKGVILSDLICIFAMSIVGFSCFFCNTKISENSDMAKSWATFCCSDT